MITGLIISIFFGFINAIFGLLPTGTLDSDITTAIDWFFYKHTALILFFQYQQ